jgi:L-iditol 2-dehydrogenase
MATDVSEYRLQTARAFGADAVIHAAEDITESVRRINAGRLADLVIVCTGALAAFRQALNAVDRGGTILCFATTEPDVELSVPLNEFWRNEIKLIPSYGNSPLDSTVAIELIRLGRVPVGKMITHRLPLDKAGYGFRLVAEGGESLKVVIEPQISA